MKCARCGGPVLLDGDDLACLWCGEYIHETLAPTTETPGHMGRPGVRQSGLWEPPADLEPASDVPANALGSHPDGRRKSSRGWH